MSPKPSWRDHWRIHPAADVFPLMSAGELQEFATNIKANSLEIPIETRRTDKGLYVLGAYQAESYTKLSRRLTLQHQPDFRINGTKGLVFI